MGSRIVNEPRARRTPSARRRRWPAARRGCLRWHRIPPSDGRRIPLGTRGSELGRLSCRTIRRCGAASSTVRRGASADRSAALHSVPARVPAPSRLRARVVVRSCGWPRPSGRRTRPARPRASSTELAQLRVSPGVRADPLRDRRERRPRVHEVARPVPRARPPGVPVAANSRATARSTSGSRACASLARWSA